MARPRAGEWLEDEVANYKREGVNIVISLLEPHEIDELDLRQERRCCEAAEIMFRAFPIADRGTPTSMSEAKKFIDEIASFAKQDKKNCYSLQGRNRSFFHDSRGSITAFWTEYGFSFSAYCRL